MTGPVVTVLVPARDEARDIERCLRAVLAQDHPHNRMEIIVVDGGSRDGTAEVVARTLAGGDVAWRLVENPASTTPSNLNAGLAVAAGDLLCRVDARSVIPAHYVRCCVEVLSSRPEVMVTGGAQVALALDGSARAVGIARALNNRFSMGGSPYRAGGVSGPVDTVYLGAFRTAQLRAVGGWDEALLTNQDFDLNRRLGRAGAVWFDARLPVGYVPRRRIVDLWRQYHRFGRWKVRYWRHSGDRPLPRQWALLLAGPTAAALVAASLVPARRRIGRLLAAAATAAGVVAVVERRGTSEPTGDRAAHAFAAVAMVAVSGGWLTGVFRAVLSPERGGRL
ncbi:MAG TPA: hypothetical protein DCS55_10535 [Acidimicrobiaceae bacterium]|nr:hypothetical protein [Acidimicrobiaceae bacterium]